MAEGVPESRRVEAGVIMQTSSPLGLALASAVNYQVAGVWFANEPQSSWRYVFLAGLLPVVVVLGVRLLLRESTVWQESRVRTALSTPRELFAPGMRAATVSGFFVAVVAILTWWACNAFLPLLGSTLAHEHARSAGLAGPEAQLLAAAWQAYASSAFNNIGRVLAAGGPFVIGVLSAMAGGSSAAIMHILLWFAAVPLAAALAAPLLIIETRGRALPA